MNYLIKYNDPETQEIVEHRLEDCTLSVLAAAWADGLEREKRRLRQENDELRAERDRYRDALNVIAKETIDIGIHDIAEKALKGDE
jgi:hypothetical protein